MKSDPFQDMRAKNKVTLLRYERGVITRAECELQLSEHAVELLTATLAEAKKPAPHELPAKELSEFELVALETKWAKKARSLMREVDGDLARIGERIARGEGCECCGKGWQSPDGRAPRTLAHARYCSYWKACDAADRMDEAVSMGLARFIKSSDIGRLKRFRDRYQVAEVIENPMVEPEPMLEWRVPEGAVEMLEGVVKARKQSKAAE